MAIIFNGDGGTAEVASTQVGTGADAVVLNRWVPVAGGAALVLIGLSRRSMGGAMLALLGGGLIYRGTVANRPLVEAIQATTIGNSTVVSPSIVKVQRAVTIYRPVEELYRFWRDFENLPRFMKHLEAVHSVSNGRSHWVAKAPLGANVTWDAEITQDRENEAIGWESLPGADVANSGIVQFQPAPNGAGTEVKVTLQYQPPGGAAGAMVAKLFGEEPGQQVADDLRRFKELMEAGEIATIDGQASARPTI